MWCLQSHSNILPYKHALMVTLLPLVSAKLIFWVDVLLLRTFFRPPLCPRHCCNVIADYANVYSRGFWCQRFLPTGSMPEDYLQFSDRLYPIPPLDLLVWSAWPSTSFNIPNAKLLVPVHLFLVANCLQHPIQMHLPSPEIRGLPWPIPLL